VSHTGASTIRWRKSSRSARDNCVEVARTAQRVLVRDSKDPDGAVLHFCGPDWRAFLTTLDDGAFDRGDARPDRD
jgi:hypothetical protein